MGRPAASAEVQPAGRSALELRFQIAACAGCRARRTVLRVVELVEVASCWVDHDGVTVARATLTALNRRAGAQGVGPGSLWLANWNVIGTSGCDGDTTVNGMPNVGPKTKWMLVAALSMLAVHAALCGLTGRFAMGVFQTLSAGKIGQLGRPGSGMPADATTGAPIAAMPSHSRAAAMTAPTRALQSAIGFLPVDGSAHGRSG